MKKYLYNLQKYDLLHRTCFDSLSLQFVYMFLNSPVTFIIWDVNYRLLNITRLDFFRH